MLAAGIKSPVPLEELEGHLREEIERQVVTGLSAETAFEIAAQKFGRGATLKSEFAKANGFFLGNTSKRINQLLAILCLLACLWLLSKLLRSFLAVNDLNLAVLVGGRVTVFGLRLVIFWIYLGGAIGSVLLFLGSKLGHSIVRIIALLFLIFCLLQLFNLRLAADWRVWCGACAMFSLISIILLHLPNRASADAELVTK